MARSTNVPEGDRQLTPWCLIVLMLAPAVTVVGFETNGHRHLTDALIRN